MTTRPELLAALHAPLGHHGMFVPERELIGQEVTASRGRWLRWTCVEEVEVTRAEEPVVQGWEAKLRDVMERKAEALKIRREFLRAQAQVAVLTREVAAIKLRAEEYHVPVQSMAPEPYEVLKPFVVVVRSTGEEDEYSARFPDANLQSYGSNQAEAVRNLKSLILDVFDSLLAKSNMKLARGPQTQLAVLREFLKKRD